MSPTTFFLSLVVFQAVFTITDSTTILMPSASPINSYACWNYRTLSDPTRNIDKASGRCMGNDFYLYHGWHRFTGDAGDRMLDYCPYQHNNYECGARYKGWMQGRLPEVYEGPVHRYVYFASGTNCYYGSRSIQVQNCGSYYVYYLVGYYYSSCHRYCGLKSISTESAWLSESMSISELFTTVLPQTTPASQAVDGCRHYQTLSDGSRAVTHANWNYRQCDDKLYGWYRFMADAGNRMLDYCPLATSTSRHKCGSYYQGWITSGSMPRAHEGEVSRLVCFSDHNSCACKYQKQIKIRNCGSFYVYWITGVPTCYQRYCGVKDKSAEVTCGENLMRIDLYKRFFNVSAYSSITLRNPACQASWSRYSKYITAGTFPSQCASSRRDTTDYIIYENEVIMKAKPTSGMITRNNDIKVRFECSYKKEGFVSTVSWKPISSINGTESGMGSFIFYFRMYKDKRYSEVHPYFPVKINLRDWIYFEAYAQVSDKSLVVLIDQCYSTPTMDRNHPQKYTFINEGCPKDDTVKFYNSNGITQRFGMQAYKYTNSTYGTAVYIHCVIFVCYKTSTNERCTRGCDGNNVNRGRTRRDLDGGAGYQDEKKTYSKYYLVEAGPLVIDDSIPDSKSEKGKSEGGFSTTTMLLIVGVALLGIIIIILAVKMRRSNSPAANKQLEIGIDNAPNGKQYVITDEHTSKAGPDDTEKKEEAF